MKDETLIVFKLFLIKNNAYKRYILALRTLHKPNGIDIKQFTDMTRCGSWIFCAFSWVKENEIHKGFVNWTVIHGKWVHILLKIYENYKIF